MAKEQAGADSHEIHALVIDDDPLSVELLQYVLPTDVGKYLRLSHVASLSKAFHHIESGARVDVALLDLSLGSTSGRKTLKEFQKNAPKIPVIPFWPPVRVCVP